MASKWLCGRLLGATALTVTMAGAANADDIADLKAQVQAMSRRLAAMEAQNADLLRKSRSTHLVVAEKAPARTAAPPAIAPGTPLSLQRDQNGNILGFLNNPVMLYSDQNTSVHLYGLLEGTISAATNQNAMNQTAVGFQTAWFSGNRWGIDADHAPDLGVPGLKLISKLESEFELPSGAFDTPNVIFNRDAWVGFYADDLGKLTFGRQNTLTRDFTQTWGDAYGTPYVTLKEGGYTNVNNFKQFIFYSADPGGTRDDSSIVWKKQFGEHWVVGAMYGFGFQGVGGSSANIGGGLPGNFLGGSSEAFSVAYNGLSIGPGKLSVNVNYDRGNPYSTVTTNSLVDQAVLVGGDYIVGIWKLNAGYVHYTGQQGINNSLGLRVDNSWTVSGSVQVAPKTELALGLVDMSGRNAASIDGVTLNPFLADATLATATASGSKRTVFGSIMYHADRQTDLYVAADYMKVGGGWVVGDAQGNGNVYGVGHPANSELEVATGVRFKF
jgi:predicted porin